MTGSTSGIGRAIARRLSSEGHAIVLNSRNSTEAGRALAAELGNATYIQADLADDADRVRLIREAVSWRDRLDVLVNNAGISRVIPHADLMAASPAVWHELHEVNVVAPFRLVAEAESALRTAAKGSRSACVVNISSHAGVRPEGCINPLCRVQSGVESHDPAACSFACTEHSGKRRRPWLGGYASDSGLDGFPKALAGAFAYAPCRQARGYRPNCFCAGSLGLPNRGNHSSGWWAEFDVADQEWPSSAAP